MATTFEKTRSEHEKEQLSFSFFVAIAIHILLLFGIGFTTIKFKPTVHSIDVTLAQHPSQIEPDEASFIAQHNQQGSGDSPDKEELTTDIQAARNQQDISQQASSSRSALEQQKVITTAGPSRNTVTTDKNPQELKDPVESNDDADRNLVSESLSSLQARLDRIRQEYSKIPRIKVLTSVSTKSADDATYMFNWVQHVEKVGNQHYPEEAQSKAIYGHLQLSVTILPDGSVEAIDIVRSSGYSILDQAAVRTVRLASPFAPFSDKMREYDKYEIIRTWKYIPGDTLTTDG